MRQLAAALRELKAATGLSMAGLAAKTPYSKSSWERYLNGRTLPPREAVEELCRLAGEPEGRCVALWELAEAETSGRAASAPAPCPATSPRPASGASSRPTSGASSPPPSGASARPVPGASRQAAPGASAQPVPRTSRQAAPGAAPQAAPRTSAQAVPAASPQTTPRTSPQPVPRTSRQAAPATSPQPAPAATPPPLPEHRTVAALAVLASVCAVVVSAVVVALLLLPESHSSTPLAPTAATSPGPGCHGAACEGRNPIGMRCAPQPDTVARHRMASGAWMELRHSRECGTTWARTWGGRIGDRIEMSVPGRAGGVHGAEVGSAVDADSYVYTLMSVTAPGTVVRACLQPAAGGRKECFDGRVR
jgi:hypothetical protein